MPKLVQLLSQSLPQLQTQVVASAAQLTTQQDPEALHRLRVSLRQLRSVLRPLRRDLVAAKTLDSAVQQRMRATNALRDAEVLALELKQQQMFTLAREYDAQLQAGYLSLAAQLDLDVVGLQMDALSAVIQGALKKKTAAHLTAQICEKWIAQRSKLLKLIQQKHPDKHHLRILIKQLRYSAEVYQAILPKQATKQIKRLKSLQETLGTWHDYFVWLEQAEQHTALHPLIPIWQTQMKHWEQASDTALSQLNAEFLAKPL